MKFLFDFFPIVLFFAVFHLSSQDAPALDAGMDSTMVTWQVQQSQPYPVGSNLFAPSVVEPDAAFNLHLQTGIYTSTVLGGAPSLFNFYVDTQRKTINGQGNFFLATGVLLGATLFQVLYLLGRYRRLEKMHIINFGLVLLLGIATIAFQKEELFQWKVSIVNWIFGLVFLASQFFTRKSLVERMMSHALTVPPVIWSRLNLMWATFFIVIGFVNLYVMSFYSLSTWVSFKLYGLLGMTFAFLIAQGFYLGRHIIEEEETATPEPATSE